MPIANKLEDGFRRRTKRTIHQRQQRWPVLLVEQPRVTDEGRVGNTEDPTLSSPLAGIISGGFANRFCNNPVVATQRMEVLPEMSRGEDRGQIFRKNSLRDKHLGARRDRGHVA